MRWAFLLLVGCRQILGIDDPRPLAIDAPQVTVDAPLDTQPCSDSDGDGICDAVDDWPCGVKPTALGVVTESDNNGQTLLQITGFGFGTAGTLFAVVAPTTALTVKFNYLWHDTSCSMNCIDQIEIGYTPGDRIGCPFDQAVPKLVGASGSLMYGLTAPAQPGVVSVRFAIAQNFSCTGGGATTWFQGPPPAANIAGYICVQ